MKTFLFAYNPNKWEWKTFDKARANIEACGSYIEQWGMFAHKKCRIGDRAYLIRLGSGIAPKGIIGAGTIVSNPELKPHWNDSQKKAYRVNIEFDTLSETVLLTMDELRSMIDYHWSIQASGLELEESKARVLEQMWQEHNLATVEKNNISHFQEGKQFIQLSKRFERSQIARQICLNHFGPECQVCGFLFEDVYGAIGKDFIHIHHITELSRIAKSYSVDPISDLRPVCPNCHAMLHNRTPAFTIEELKAIMAV